MKNIKISIKLIAIILFLFTLQPVLGEVLTSEQLELDKNLIKAEGREYILPERIEVVVVETPSKNFKVDGREWFRGLFYFFAGRSGFNDIPFHYVVTADGLVMEGVEDGDEQKVFFKDGEANTLYIAYLADEETGSFSSVASKPLENLLLSVANKNNIKPENINVSRARVEKSSDNQTSIISEDIPGRYVLSMESMKESIKKNFNPVIKKYNIKVVSVKQPQEKVNPGSEVLIDITLRNDSDYSIFQDTNSEIIAFKKDKKGSIFAINGTWLSGFQVSLMKENDIQRIGAEKTYQFKLHIPLYFGRQEEVFMLQTIGGQSIEGSEFSLSLDINKIDKPVVEILNTEIGSLNVRDRASGFGTKIESVFPGSRYIELERTSTGWVKIDLGDGRSGWVLNKYTKRIQ